MPLQFELIEETDYLRVVVTGRYDVGEAIDGFSHVIARCRATGESMFRPCVVWSASETPTTKERRKPNRPHHS